MSTEQPLNTEPQPWGAPQPAAPQRARWSGRKAVAAVAIAVTIAAGGGAAIWAATANDNGVTQGGPGGGGPGFGVGGGMVPGGGQAPGAIGELAEALHGEFVIADGSTRLLQRGEVTSVSDSSVEVKSSDDYTRTYTIDSSTVKSDDIQTGDTVVVIAEESGAAVAVTEPSATMPNGRRDGQPPQQPVPPLRN